MSKWRCRIESGLEYILALMFIQGGIRTLLFADPVVLPGIFSYLVGSAAVYVYGALFLTSGLLLLYAKIRKHKKLHKHLLMAMFLTCVYVLILALAINGFVPRLILTVSVGAVAAYSWLRWTIRTEYINPKDFASDIDKLT